VQIHSQTKEITLTGLYWALVHHARAFRRGAMIVASHDANGDLLAVNAAAIGPPASSSTVTAPPNTAAISRVYHTAAKNSDGSLVLVLTNPGDAKDATVACAWPDCENTANRGFNHHPALELNSTVAMLDYFTDHLRFSRTICPGGTLGPWRSAPPGDGLTSSDFLAYPTRGGSPQGDGSLLAARPQQAPRLFILHR
jgi:Glycosyl hydrolase family 30 beta sandwich domain